MGGQRHSSVDLRPGKTRYVLHRRLDGPQGGLDGCGKSRPQQQSVMIRLFSLCTLSVLVSSFKLSCILPICLLPYNTNNINNHAPRRSSNPQSQQAIGIRSSPLHRSATANYHFINFCWRRFTIGQFFADETCVKFYCISWSNKIRTFPISTRFRKAIDMWKRFEHMRLYWQHQ